LGLVLILGLTAEHGQPLYSSCNILQLVFRLLLSLNPTVELAVAEKAFREAENALFPRI